MDKEELQQKIALYYSKLPPKAQAVFSSMKWLETIKSISEKYGLNDKQKEILGTETTLVLLGIIDIIKYEEILIEELALSKESVDKMLSEINDLIINNIRPELIDAFNANKNSLEKENQEIEPVLDPRFGKLSPDLEKIIDESNYQDILYGIGKEKNFSVTKMGALERATTDLIMGTIHPDEFENVLENNLELPLEKVRELVNIINERIFKKIREELIKNVERKKIFANKKAEEKQDTQVLGAHGIEIVENPPLLIKEGAGGGNSEENHPASGTPPQQGGEETHPLLAQKISRPYQAPVVK